MARALILVFSLAAFSAFAFDLEKFIDKHMDTQFESWTKEKIETLATDRDPKERLEAAEWLSGRNEPDAIAALAAALSDRDARVRLAAASGLWRAEKAAEPARAQLLKALDDSDPNVVARAAGALQVIGMKEAELAAARKRVFNSPESSLDSRFLVARNLVGHEPPVRLLEPMLAYLERSARGYTGSVSDPRRKNIEIVEQALENLVKATKDRSLIRPLAGALGSAKAGQIVLLKTLAFFEPKPDGWTQLLLGQLDSPNPEVRYAALGQLRHVKKEKDVGMWVPRAAAMLQDPDSSVRSEALWALGGAAGLAAGEIDKVIAALGDSNKSVRHSAARAIGEIGEQTQAIPAASKARIAAAARPALAVAMEKDEDADVRAEARSALAKLGTGTAVALASAAAAPTPTGSESSGMALLRERKVTFEETSYYRALSDLDVDLVRAFLDAGMSPKASMRDMGSPIRVMLFAAEACSPRERPTKAETKAMVKLLLERGADPNVSDSHGNTALMEAASKGCDRELFRLLIKAGANVSAANFQGLTPFEMGLWYGHDGLEELIVAGYRLPPDKAKMYAQALKDRPGSQAMIKKATRK